MANGAGNEGGQGGLDGGAGSAWCRAGWQCAEVGEVKQGMGGEEGVEAAQERAEAVARVGEGAGGATLALQH